MSRIYLYLKTPAPLPRRDSAAILHRYGLTLLRQALEEVCGLAYSREALSYPVGRDETKDPSCAVLLGPGGKPYLADHPAVHFNLTHCSGLIACALSDSPIGIDAEGPRRVSPALLSRVLTDREREELHSFSKKPQEISGQKALTSSGRLSFSRLWTCKEALAKCTGLGLGPKIYRVDFKPASPTGYIQVSFFAPGDGPSSPAESPALSAELPRFSSLPPVCFQEEDYALAQSRLPGDHIISICSAGPIDEILIREQS